MWLSGLRRLLSEPEWKKENGVKFSIWRSEISGQVLTRVTKPVVAIRWKFKVSSGAPLYKVMFSFQWRSLEELSCWKFFERLNFLFAYQWIKLFSVLKWPATEYRDFSSLDFSWFSKVLVTFCVPLRKLNYLNYILAT